MCGRQRKEWITSLISKHETNSQKSVFEAEWALGSHLSRVQTGPLQCHERLLVLVVLVHLWEVPLLSLLSANQFAVCYILAVFFSFIHPLKYLTEFQPGDLGVQVYLIAFTVTEPISAVSIHFFRSLQKFGWHYTRIYLVLGFALHSIQRQQNKNLKFDFLPSLPISILFLSRSLPSLIASNGSKEIFQPLLYHLSYTTKSGSTCLFDDTW